MSDEGQAGVGKGGAGMGKGGEKPSSRPRRMSLRRRHPEHRDVDTVNGVEGNPLWLFSLLIQGSEVTRGQGHSWRVWGQAASVELEGCQVEKA